MARCKIPRNRRQQQHVRALARREIAAIRARSHAEIDDALGRFNKRTMPVTDPTLLSPAARVKLVEEALSSYISNRERDAMDLNRFIEALGFVPLRCTSETMLERLDYVRTCWTRYVEGLAVADYFAELAAAKRSKAPAEAAADDASFTVIAGDPLREGKFAWLTEFDDVAPAIGPHHRMASTSNCTRSPSKSPVR